MRIEGANVGHKVVLEKDPGAADLGAGNAAELGALAQLFRMNT